VASGLITAYSNVDKTNPVQDATINATGAYKAAPLITTSDDTMLSLFLSSGNGTSIWAEPSGWTPGYPGGQNATSCGTFYKLQPFAGDTGTVVAPEFNIPYADIGYAHLVALNPCSLCGDENVDGVEQCDDGNTNNGDGCSSTCTVEACADGEMASDSLLKYDIAVCSGEWSGTIGSASAESLCAPGWHVCSYLDSELNNVSFAEATSFGGCFAYNAAQDNNTCIECLLNSGENNDMAGLGSGCGFQDGSAQGCTGSGRIDIQSNFANDCEYQPGYTTGVACCKD
jgi:cysteine-rich repeat protein